MARGAQALIDISRAGAREGSERDRGAIARLWHVLSDKTTGTVHGMACTVRAQHPVHPKRWPASYIVVGGGGRYLVPAIPARIGKARPDAALWLERTDAPSRLPTCLATAGSPYHQGP